MEGPGEPQEHVALVGSGEPLPDAQVGHRGPRDCIGSVPILEQRGPIGYIGGPGRNQLAQRRLGHLGLDGESESARNVHQGHLGVPGALPGPNLESELFVKLDANVDGSVGRVVALVVRVVPKVEHAPNFAGHANVRLGKGVLDPLLRVRGVLGNLVATRLTLGVRLDVAPLLGTLTLHAVRGRSTLHGTRGSAPSNVGGGCIGVEHVLLFAANRRERPILVQEPHPRVRLVERRHFVDKFEAHDVRLVERILLLETPNLYETVLGKGEIVALRLELEEVRELGLVANIVVGAPGHGDNRGQVEPLVDPKLSNHIVEDKLFPEKLLTIRVRVDNVLANHLGLGLEIKVIVHVLLVLAQVSTRHFHRPILEEGQGRVDNLGTQGNLDVKVERKDAARVRDQIFAGVRVINRERGLEPTHVTSNLDHLNRDAIILKHVLLKGSLDTLGQRRETDGFVILDGDVVHDQGRLGNLDGRILDPGILLVRILLEQVRGELEVPDQTVVARIRCLRPRVELSQQVVNILFVIRLVEQFVKVYNHTKCPYFFYAPLVDVALHRGCHSGGVLYDEWSEDTPDKETHAAECQMGHDCAAG